MSEEPIEKIVEETKHKGQMVYCPSCGIWGDPCDDMIFNSISPGEYLWSCGNCGTSFKIKIAFYEQ